MFRIRINRVCSIKKDNLLARFGPQLRASRIPTKSSSLAKKTRRSLHPRNHPSAKKRLQKDNSPIIQLEKTLQRNFSVMTNEKNEKDQPVTVLEDNPCWGSSTKLKLEDLLSIIHRSTSIIYDSPYYCVLNKPPDLRMDGPYAATVHKLLTYWYPPPSVTNSLKERESQDQTEDSLNKSLLEAVSKLHRYNDVRDNFIRPCHQLDYATSGVLLVAKTQEAAGHIGRLFEERHEGVQKSYMAVLVGDLRKGLLSDESKVPMWTEGNSTQDLRKQLQQLEESHRRKRAAVGKQHCRVRDASQSKKKRKKKCTFVGGTFDGFLPAHSLFVKWKSKQKAKRSAGDSVASPQKKRQKRRKLNRNADLLTEDDWKQIWDPVEKAVAENSDLLINSETVEWKQLHEEHQSLKLALIKATDIHNDILRKAIKKKEEKEEAQKDLEGDNANVGKELPLLFRLSEGDGCSNNDGDDSTFYVCCPLAQHPDQFNMVVPTSMGRGLPHLANANDKTDHKLKFRPSLTKCTVLESGTISIVRNNEETKIGVTKVRLYPMTGRRHQLRVHMALAGFPILGDVAYCGDRHSRQKKDGRQMTETDICSRMCLHAQSLQLPTLIGEDKPNWKIETPDPFVIDSDGEIKTYVTA